MAKYKENTASGETWVRSNHITIENPLGGVPQIHFREERAIALGPEEVVTKAVGSVAESMTADNLSESFPLINPETGEEIPEEFGTYQQLQVLLHSLYIHMAKKRDRGPAPYPSWSYNETTEQWEAPVVKPETTPTGDWGWNETEQTWDDVESKPDDGQTYYWRDPGQWEIWRV